MSSINSNDGESAQLAIDLRECDVELCSETFPEDDTEAYDAHLGKHGTLVT